MNHTLVDMRFLKRPTNLRLISGASFLVVPIIILNLWVYAKGLPRFLSVQHFHIAGLTAFVMATTLFLLLRRASWIGFCLGIIITTLLVSGNIYFLTNTKNYALAFYGLFIVIISTFFHISLFKLLLASYYQPGVYWFEGAPRFIPRLKAVLQLSEDKSIDVRFTKLADDGCFVYAESLSDVKRYRAGTLAIELNGSRVISHVETITTLTRCGGLGLRFIYKDFDSGKDMRDFIQTVRSAGYASQ